jgi:hypothetical protein
VAGSLTWLGHAAFRFDAFPLLTGTPELLRSLMPSEIELVAPAPGETVSL